MKKPVKVSTAGLITNDTGGPNQTAVPLARVNKFGLKHTIITTVIIVIIFVVLTTKNRLNEK